jgi:hypothetical protein
MAPQEMLLRPAALEAELQESNDVCLLALQEALQLWPATLGPLKHQEAFPFASASV